MTLALSCCLLATFMSIAGDYHLKRSAETATWHGVAICVALYAASTAPWYVVIRSTKLTTVAIVYPVVTILCLTALGVWVFGEHMTGRTWVAMGLALAAVVVLGGDA